ncbi:MAG: ATP-binding protein [Verrucomicrobiota bacterium]|jgi:signal transduction histidine kinase
MKFGVTFRLAALGAAIGVMGVSIVLITLCSQRESSELRARLSTVDAESFGISEHFKDRLREVNMLRLRDAIDHDPAIWPQFLKASHELEDWLDQQAPHLRTEHEKEVLRQARAAFDDYLQTAQGLHAPPQRQQSEAVLEFNFRSKSQHLFDLGQTLAKAHYDSRNQLLLHANQTLTRLRLLVLGLIAFLFVFGLALAAFVYRDMIVPLRVKLVESQSLVERNEKLASLGMLAAGVAHEIRNPLTAIKAALFIQQKKFKPGSEEHADAELVQREILRLERIVTQFLQFARPAEPQLARTRANAPLREVQSFLAPELAKANIRLVVEEAAPLQIQADAEQIKQVLINLVQNAADSIEHGGTITLRARADRKALADGERNVVVLEVADTGKGIPPEVEERLFDPFFTTKSMGTGLGLPIAACLVQKHGGALQYQTQLNRGTTFGIVLPEAAG